MKTLSFLLSLAVFCAVSLPSLHAASLPADERIAPILALAETIESGLAAGDPRFQLVDRKPGGTSAYALVEEGGKVIGAVIPENSATSIVGEVSTFNLGRALGCSELFQPAAKVSLRGKGLARFRAILQAGRYSGAREQNRQNILARIAKNPDALPCVYKHWGAEKPREYSAISTGGSPNGVLRESDVVARFLKAGAPQPGEQELALGGGTAPARDLARELSNIFLVDALAGQWDRFSGGNLHVRVTDGRVHFIALDNGGASIEGGMGYLELFKGWVTRFDRPVAARLLELDALLSKGQPFLGFSDADSFCAAIGLETPVQNKVLARRVASLATHVRTCLSRPNGEFR